MEFKTKSQLKEIDDNDRHVKLIKISGKKVEIHEAIHEVFDYFFNKQRFVKKNSYKVYI